MPVGKNFIKHFTLYINLFDAKLGVRLKIVKTWNLIFMNFLGNITAQLPFGKKNTLPEYFFALTVGLSRVSAAVWELDGNKLDVLGQATLSYHDLDDLVEKIQHVLDKSLGSLEVEPQKILFGVPENWSREDELKEPYLKLLRRVLKEYELSALAYVSIPNAISFYLQKQENVPPTAILLGVGDFVEVTLVRGGKVVDSRSTERSDNLFDDLEKVLDKLVEAEVLPSKILLYATKEGEDVAKLKAELMSFRWMQKLPFLHFPKIDSLEDEVESRAVVFAGASEVNPGVNIHRSFLAHAKGLPKLNRPSGLREMPSKEENKEPPAAEDDNSGFVHGDIREKIKSKLSLTRLRAEDLKEDHVASPDVDEEGFSGVLDETMEEEYIEPSNYTQSRRPNPLARVLSRTKSLIPMPSLTEPPELSSVFKSVFSKFIAVPIALVIFAAAYIVLMKATVTVFVEPKILERDAEIVADPGVSAADEEKKVIPAALVETTVSGSDTIGATGQKQIGDPARGKVHIYNMTNSRVSISQGTVLKANNGLKFVLDVSAQIASQSATQGVDKQTVIKPGKSDPTGITAQAIGPESNLSAGTDLIVGNYPDSQVVATVSDALSGGTSKNVVIVTSDDQKKLKAKILDQLKQKAEEDLRGKLPPEKKVIADALTVVDGKYNYSKQPNDQAKEFSLSATVRFRGTSYSDPDLRAIVARLVETNVPDNFELNLQSTETQADVEKVEKDGRLIFRARFRAKLLPKLDTEELKKQMRGRGINEVGNKLKEIENVIGSEIVLSPSLPASFARMPFLDKNITVNISPK